MLLITGATGNIGRALVPLLVAAGEPVRVFVRDISRVASFDGGIDVAQGDLDQPDTLGPALGGVNRVFMLTLTPRQDANVIAAAQQAGVTTLVMLSSRYVPFGVGSGPMHAPGEQVLRASALRWTILRPAEYMSNALRWVQTIRTQNAAFEPTGDGRTAVIDPVDIAAVAARVLTTDGHEGQTYELTGPKAISRAAMVADLSAALGRPLRFIDVPEAAARERLAALGLPEALREPILRYYAMVKAGEAAAVTAEVERLIGHAPRPFAAWVHDHRKAFE